MVYLSAHVHDSTWLLFEAVYKYSYANNCISITLKGKKYFLEKLVRAIKCLSDHL